ncbi:MAG: hypothetical protein IKD70_03190 [Eggerthellaceae bacterium]|nr:hypothetical protein [Eggerthellaceae bacterium]
MESKLLRRISSSGGMIVGIISALIGLSKPWAYPRNLSYGGDAYTGIQNAAAATARNISDIGGWLLIIIGLALFFYFFAKFPSSNSPTPATPAVVTSATSSLETMPATPAPIAPETPSTERGSTA